jgi:hypothetical protein
MGHKVNPTIFRLGISVDWKYQLRDPLLSNIHIYKTMRNLMMRYTVPYLRPGVRRTEISKKGNKERAAAIEELFDTPVESHHEDIFQHSLTASMPRPNPFQDNSLIFSHLNISYAPSLYLAIFLLDADAEHKRLLHMIPENRLYGLTGKFYPNKPRHFMYFIKKGYYNKKEFFKLQTRPKTWIFYSDLLKEVSKVANKGRVRLKRKDKKFLRRIMLLHQRTKQTQLRYPTFNLYRTRILQRLRRAERFLSTKIPGAFKLNRYRRHETKVIVDSKLEIRRVKFKLKKINLSSKRFPLWFANHNLYRNDTHQNTHNQNTQSVMKNIKILKFLLRWIKLYKRTFSKKRLFFFYILINCIASLLLLIPKNTFSRRLFVFLTLCYMYLYTFRHLHFRYNKAIFQNRLLFFCILSKVAVFSLKKVAFISTGKDIIIRYYGLHNRNVTAQFLVNYLLVKLRQYFVINAILNPITQRLRTLAYIKGYRIVISGRLNRRERASYFIKSYKAMPLSTYKARVDYANDFVILKFGVVGIKVYLLYDRTPPYYYFFEYKTPV